MQSQVNRNGGWSQQYSYDGFGNLTGQLGSGGAPTHSYTVDANNHITSPAQNYDLNGNATPSGYAYDVENRLVSDGALRYGYDPQNKRVWVADPGAVDAYGNPTSYTVKFYGVDGKLLATYGFTVGAQFGALPANYAMRTTVSQELWFGSRRLAPMDRLGSVGVGGEILSIWGG